MKTIKRKVVLFFMVFALAATLIVVSGSSLSAETKVYKWRMAECWPSGIAIHKSDVRFAARLKEVTGGRIDITVHPAGALVPPMGVFDAVSSGTVECGSSGSTYWSGKIPSADLFTAVPFGFEPEDYLQWLYHHGGLQLWRETYEKHNIIPFGLAMEGQEVGLLSNKPIRSLAELKKLRVRFAGLGGKIMGSFGSSIQMMGIGELYQALERGVLDAAECATPALNQQLGLYEVTKYMIMPGWHQPATVIELIVNKKAYDSLPDDLKAALDAVSMENMLWSYGYFEALNFKAVEDILKKGKVKVVRLDEKTLKQLKAASDKLLGEISAKDPLFKKILESQKNFIKRHKAWAEMKRGLEHLKD